MLGKHFHGTRGFTLVEMLVSLAILAVLASISAPLMSGLMDSYRVAAASRQLISDLQFAKTRAVTENTSYQVTFDTANLRYRVERCDGTNTGPWRLLTETAGSGVSLAKDFLGNLVVFGQIGEAMDSMNTPFATEAHVTIGSATGAARTVSIAGSGRLSVS